MELLALALAPGIAIMWFIYSKDRYEKEPLRALIFSFLLGMLAILPAVLIELGGTWLQDRLMTGNGWLYYIVKAFLVVALTEEASKFLMVKWYAWPRHFFNEPFDGIVYGVMVAMGFATLENIGYVMQHGWQTAILRMFLSVPAHATFGVLMGYYLGLAKFTHDSHSRQLMIRGLLLSVLFHGLFDLFLFAQEDDGITRKWSSGLLFGTAILSYFVAVRLSWQAIRMHQELSRNNFQSQDKTV